ncbi:MAG: carboxypeptidase regulatory-like domain-containing protein [Candidatus Cloacimonetes bacterium]|nr:carboxypeptidase regulatory-like domain-containing protein [Candidatus Cloacimonadota bacterium]
MKKIIVFTFLMFMILTAFSKKFTEYYFTFSISSRKELDKITQIISIDNVKNNQVWAYATDETLGKFQSMGYQITMLPHPNTLNVLQMANSKEMMRDWDSYPTYEAYVDMMYQFESDYPNLCSVQSIGNSEEGRELIVAKISDNITVEEAEPEFFYTATMHGDELVGYVLILRLIDYLLSNYGSVDRITNIVDNIEIYINPLANPDGTFAGGNSSVNGATRMNANGVDLNRNFPDFISGEHPDGNAWQAETIVMMDFAEEHNLVLSSNLHSGAEVVNYPWDTIVDRHPDDIWWQDVCHTYADAVHEVSPTDYLEGFDDGITNGYDWYSIDGGRQDYMNYYHFCREMTLELSDVKMLPENELNVHWDYNKESFLLYMEECLYGIRGIVTNESGNPLDAMITLVDHDHTNSEIHTNPTLGNYHRMIDEGDWNLLFSAEGFVPQLFENVVVTDNDITILDVTLIPQTSVTVTGLVSDNDNGEPIHNAIVEILDSSIQAVNTDVNGNFIFDEVWEDIYTFKVTKSGYSPLTQQVSVTTENNYFEFELSISTAESFEDGTFPSDWYFEGAEDWLIVSDVTYDGSYSAESGNISDNETTDLLISLDITASGQISFWSKISSENDYDYLRFFIDDFELSSWSGEIDWQEFSYNVSTGVHEFKWRYEKDGSVSSGEDCAWIDFISFPEHNDSFDDTILGLKNRLIGNYPNPFNPETTISFLTTKNTKNTKIEIYNTKGQRIREFKIHPASMQEKFKINSVVWDGKDNFRKKVSSGIYLYRIKSDNFVSETKRMLLLK